MISRFFPKPRTVLIVLLVISANLLAVDVLSAHYIFPFTTRIFAGIYTASFEHLEFTPCQNSWLSNPFNHQIWLEHHPMEEFFFQKANWAQFKKIDAPWSEEFPQHEMYVRFIGKMDFSSTPKYGHLGQYYFKVTIYKLLNISKYDPAKGQQIQLMIAAATLLTGLAVFIITGCQADRSLRGLARLKALLPALGLALLACLDVLWIVRLVNPGCG